MKSKQPGTPELSIREKQAIRIIRDALDDIAARRRVPVNTPCGTLSAVDIIFRRPMQPSSEADLLRDIAPIALYEDMPSLIRLLPEREKARLRALVKGIGLYLRTGELHDSAFVASAYSVRSGGPSITDSSLKRAVSAWKRGGIDALIDRRAAYRVLFPRRNAAAAK